MPLRFLVAESEPRPDREARRAAVGRSAGETYADVLRDLVPEAAIARVDPLDPAGDPVEVAAYDAVFLTGSPLHLHHENQDNRRLVDFMRGVFAAGVPAFGSCAGLQVATVAAGGRVRTMPKRLEAGFARRIAPNARGGAHPLLDGRPAAFDAPSIHSDEVEELPEGSVLLASNAATRVQAAEIRSGPGVFWGTQYHPELTLGEIAVALRRQADDLIEAGLVEDEATLGAHADAIEALGQAPERTDLAWRLGLNEETTRAASRTREIRNFIAHLVRPTASTRARE
jgi:GMP synthase (glutamine-hydrolysing)